jgi:hypothetical protein
MGGREGGREGFWTLMAQAHHTSGSAFASEKQKGVSATLLCCWMEGL